jgi:LacI family transcriptional regulator
MREHGLDAAGISVCDAFTREAGCAALSKMLRESRQRPDALVCANDLIALGAYNVLLEAGLRIPRDIRVTGHNDMPLVDMVDPPLTTVRLAHRELGWRAAQLLMEAIDGQQLSPATVVLRPELVVRASSA